MMIGFLSGKVKFKEPESLTVEANGVGWQVKVPTFLWSQVKVGQTEDFYIQNQVRDDQLLLFGFPNLETKKIFLQLTSVSGIGHQLALAIISHAVDPKKVVQAIQRADVDFFTAVKGVGKKSAQRIIVDLKPKVGSLKEIDLKTEKDEELTEALKGLGFSQSEIKQSIKGISRKLSLEKRLRQALKKTGK